MEVRTLNIPLPEDLLKLKWNGQFDLMKEMIDLRVQKDIPSDLKERLLLEKEIIDDLAREFIYTKEEAIDILKKNIIDFKKEEFDDLFKQNAFEFLFVNGIMMFKEDFYDNLIKVNTAYTKRNKEEISNARAEMLDKIITEQKQEGELFYKIHLKLSIKIKEEYQKVGKIIRVWLPVPVEYAQVEDFKLISCSPSGILNDEGANHRCVYFECPYEKNQEFFVEFEFINHSIYRELDPLKVKRVQPTFYLEETPPHYVFTPYLRNLVSEVIGDEKNPLLKAKKIYEWITSHVTYSFVRQYITLPNIPEYAATGLKGDCGIQASLFITMCRIAGIPADWQAGLYTNPIDVGNHDWARFYIEPYGWLFADCSFGGGAYRAGSKLRRDFYFGHLEPYRCPMARGFQEDLVPKNHFTRRDPYDNQTGECEYIDEAIPQDGYEMIQEMISIDRV